MRVPASYAKTRSAPLTLSAEVDLDDVGDVHRRARRDVLQAWRRCVRTRPLRGRRGGSRCCGTTSTLSLSQHCSRTISTSIVDRVHVHDVEVRAPVRAVEAGGGRGDRDDHQVGRPEHGERARADEQTQDHEQQQSDSTSCPPPRGVYTLSGACRAARRSPPARPSAGWPGLRRPAVGGDDAVRDREAEPGPALAPACKNASRTRPSSVFRNPRPGVGDLEARPARPRRRARQLDAADGAAVHRLDRVEREVDQDLAELAAVPAHRAPRRPPTDELDPEALAGRCQQRRDVARGGRPPSNSSIDRRPPAARRRGSR